MASLRERDELAAEQKEVLAKMVQDARTGGIHDTLAYIDEMMDCNGLILSQEGDVCPYDYFESMHDAFICRSEGDAWTESLDKSPSIGRSPLDRRSPFSAHFDE